MGGHRLAGRHLSGSIGVATQAPDGSQPSEEPLWYFEAAAVTGAPSGPTCPKAWSLWDQGTYYRLLLMPTFVAQWFLLPQGFSPC